MDIEKILLLKEGDCVECMPIKPKRKIREYKILNMRDKNNILLLETSSFKTNGEEYMRVPIDWFKQNNIV